MAWQNWGQQVPEEKVYLHLDRPLYRPGESIWFVAYVRQGETFQPTQLSDVVFVELIDPKGGVLDTHRMLVEQGRAQGEFSLPATASGGRYRLKAYTRWLQEDPQPAIFEKEVMVQAVVTPRLKMKLDFEREAYGLGGEAKATLKLEGLDNQALAGQAWAFQLKSGGQLLAEGTGQTDAKGEADIEVSIPNDLPVPNALLWVRIPYQGMTESISRAVPLVLEGMDLEFFPEGGDMLVGCEGRVAFRAWDAHGQPADVAGFIFDEAGDTVTAFRSFHQGMGVFYMQARPGGRYHARLVEPFVSNESWSLPQPQARGYALRVDSIAPSQAFLQVLSSESGRIGLLATVRGKVVYAAEQVIEPGTTPWVVPLDDFPMGVVQFTLMDDRKVPRAERLAFVNTHRQMQIEVSTDRAQYLPREEVMVSLRTTDERGLPLPAQLSMAVVDDRLRHFADDKRSNLLSWLLMESDIQGNIEDPA
ncbi:MAG: hypothetical protein D6722_05175, partial [Bacteroidetes bacterium]